MEELISISSHPKVGVHIQTQESKTGDSIVRVTLFLSSRFVLQCSSKMIQKSIIPWLRNYSQGEWTPFSLPPLKTAFAQKAASSLKKVPFGRVISYQELAEAIDHPRAARAIGNFCRGNLFPLFIPCHRVIPSSGRLGAFTPDPRIKEQLLQFEGITLL